MNGKKGVPWTKESEIIVCVFGAVVSMLVTLSLSTMYDNGITPHLYGVDVPYYFIAICAGILAVVGMVLFDIICIATQEGKNMADLGEFIFRNICAALSVQLITILVLVIGAVWSMITDILFVLMCILAAGALFVVIKLIAYSLSGGTIKK